jgi:hypothetical protein
MEALVGQLPANFSTRIQMIISGLALGHAVIALMKSPISSLIAFQSLSLMLRIRHHGTAPLI